jgi:adenylate cyclase
MPIDPPVERKLAAIMVADVEGYSRKMHENEERTLATLTAHRRIVDERITQHNGNVIGSAGDSIVADFASGVEAVNCAVAIQRSLYKANLGLPQDQRMDFRIGINVGDVMSKDGELYGDGINVAARIEALAEPGGICITRATRDNVRDKVEYHFEDLGEKQVKNIPRPVRIFTVTFDRSEPTVTEDTKVQDITRPEKEEAKNSEPLDPTEVEIEVAFWNTVKDSGDAEMFKAYLDKYPQGEFRKLAEISLSKLGEQSERV